MAFTDLDLILFLRTGHPADSEWQSAGPERFS
ncbi:hypothetical protein PDIG_03060 [Penicillium digitatum PHI26]|uniref:Uncharacterized protein n=2 Tax=Penicillium digitatum TaxID=36651 RepID=K9GE88_PEND2|nr:hypothetical protein PDIP_41710 [Penicillium digitatum Pd1]EKV15001.1 hypothetical protein PDIP_41710 [Penicillium digitatum Pd1]EKV19349.1 hypothetical protein PDIG_03060 [Penicillium digitatum PHI26]